MLHQHIYRRLHRHSPIQEVVRSAVPSLAPCVHFPLQEQPHALLNSGDLANIHQEQGSAAADVSALLQLRDELYSERFRKHVESIVGCPPLSSKVCRCFMTFIFAPLVCFIFLCFVKSQSRIQSQLIVDIHSQVDCSCNVYSRGGHLLCHDDVIGTRCVSYILYLTDPDMHWTATNGGALELYPIQSNSGGTHTQLQLVGLEVPMGIVWSEC